MDEIKKLAKQYLSRFFLFASFIALVLGCIDKEIITTSFFLGVIMCLLFSLRFKG